MFTKLCEVEECLLNIFFFRLFYSVHSSFYFQHGRHVEGVIIIELSSYTKQGDLLKGPLFTLAHYQVFLKTIV